MAKQKMVAKVCFDDGSKKGPNGKSTSYNVGEEYQGDASALKKAVKEELVCAESELKVTKESLDAKDQVIAKLEAKVAEQKEVITGLEQSVSELSAKLEEASKK